MYYSTPTNCITNHYKSWPIIMVLRELLKMVSQQQRQLWLECLQCLPPENIEYTDPNSPRSI